MVAMRGAGELICTPSDRISMPRAACPLQTASTSIAAVTENCRSLITRSGCGGGPGLAKVKTQRTAAIGGHRRSSRRRGPEVDYSPHPVHGRALPDRSGFARSRIDGRNVQLRRQELVQEIVPVPVLLGWDGPAAVPERVGVAIRDSVISKVISQLLIDQPRRATAKLAGALIRNPCVSWLDPGETADTPSESKRRPAAPMGTLVAEHISRYFIHLWSSLTGYSFSLRLSIDGFARRCAPK